MKPFEEIVKFIADTAGAEKLGAFKPSAAAERRVAELLAKQQAGQRPRISLLPACAATLPKAPTRELTSAARRV
jgi:hypothetical protein